MAHNRYRSALPSGEDRSVDATVEALRRRGVEVRLLERRSDDIADLPLTRKLTLPVQPTYGRDALADFDAAVAEFGPDLLHVENVFPMISPTIIRRAARIGLPVVQAVRNYRHVCMAGTYFRDGHQCFECRNSSAPWPGVFHGCYRGSRAQSAAMAVSLSVHRRTWAHVDRFLPTSGYLAEHLEMAGVPRERVTIRPNFVADPGGATAPGTGFVFAGRLEEEKGLSLLLDAWRQAHAHISGVLTIAGSGPLEGVARAAERELPRLRVVGQVRGDEVDALVARAGAVVAPSVWPEPFGRTVIEAFAFGRPAVATAVGGQAELVDDTVGWSAPPTVAGLAAALVDASDLDACEVRGAAARQRYLERYTEDASMAILLATYADVTATTGPSDVGSD